MRAGRVPAGWLVLLWFLTRAGVVALLLGPESAALGDLQYFGELTRQLGDTGVRDVLPEYPLVGVLLLTIPTALAALVGQSALYGAFFVAMTLGVDAAFARAVHRDSTDDMPVLAWIGLVTARAA